MENFKSHFKFNKQERSGIFFLLFIIVALQIGFFFGDCFSPDSPSPDTLSVDTHLQARIMALKKRALAKDSITMRSFNPNFISDYKGYVLGMSPAEIDRLKSFRDSGRYVNSAVQFQEVTRVSDTLLSSISPYFRFPEWTKRKKRPAFNNTPNNSFKKGPKRAIKDLNQATAEELRSINGIGEKLSARIIKFRDRLGGFLMDGQLYDVYGLPPEVVARTLEHFKVITVPDIDTIFVNTASAQELSKLIYIQKHVADNIVNYRNLNGSILSFDELSKIEDFPTEKINRIALYLSLKK